MSVRFPSKCDYFKVIDICQDWMDNYSSAHKCGSSNLLKSLELIINEIPAFCIKDTRPFGDLLGRFEEEEYLVFLMKVLLAHVNNPNFILRSGKYKGKTLLQGAIATENKYLVRLLLSNNHGSKIFEIKEPIIIDYESKVWIDKNI
jgi:hypothetical protein